MPVSPIDWIRHRVESAGYTFGELTGRGVQLEYAPDGSATFERRTAQETSKAAKIAVIAGFNSGSVDIGLGNRSASTGYSMHSSSKFENQSRRHFLIAQPERDINVFKQFLGRFHRTGQVNAPKISLIVGDTPDEKRPAAVLAKKLTTLNANTTAAVKGGVDFEGIPDYFNEIGNQIVTDIMRDDPDLTSGCLIRLAFLNMRQSRLRMLPLKSQAVCQFCRWRSRKSFISSWIWSIRLRWIAIRRWARIRLKPQVSTWMPGRWRV